MAKKPPLRFPMNLGTQVANGQPYMLLTSYESKNAIESTGQVSHAGNDNYLSLIHI